MIQVDRWISGLAGCGILCATLFMVRPIQAGALAVDLVLIPADAQNNRLATTLSVTTLGKTVSDSDTATLTGNLLANVDVSLDSLKHEVTAIHSIEFTGGLIHMSNMSFTLSYGLLGKIEARTMGVAGVPSSPSGPGPVVGESFNTIDHMFVFNQGTVTAYGTGLIGEMFDPINQDLSIQPIEASADSVGTISVALDNIADNQVTYRVYLILPVLYDQEIPVNESITATFAGSGLIVAAGTISVPICPLLADLVGEDCRVDLADLAEFCEQWLVSSDQITCPLSADLSGQDCFVGLDDFTVLISEWLAEE